MAEYIEREEVFRKLREEPMPWGQRWDAAIEDFVRDIRKIPAADVRPERYGEWVYGENDIPHCSKCGAEVKEISLFCPKCGAKMDGEDE